MFFRAVNNGLIGLKSRPSQKGLRVCFLLNPAQDFSMNKSYIIALIACLVLAVVVTAGVGFLITKENPISDSSYLFAIEESAVHYRKDNPGANLKTNEEWVKALQRTDYDKFDVHGNPSTLELDDIISEAGKFVAPNGQEIQFAADADGALKVSIPGIDGGAEITSTNFRQSLDL